jgi:hypothetical protein
MIFQCSDLVSTSRKDLLGGAGGFACRLPRPESLDLAGETACPSKQPAHFRRLSADSRLKRALRQPERMPDQRAHVDPADGWHPSQLTEGR